MAWLSTFTARQRVDADLMACSIDVQDMYMHWPLTQSAAAWCGFRVQRRGGGHDAYMWKALPFGLGTSARVVQTATAAILQPLQQAFRHARAFIYLDDILLIAPRRHIELFTQKVFARLLDVGLSPNLDKCNLTPTARPEHLGVQLDIHRCTTSPTPRTVAAAVQAVRAYLARPSRWNQKRAAGKVAWLWPYAQRPQYCDCGAAACT